MRALLAVAATLLLATPAGAQGYRYHGIRQQRGPVTLELDTAHAADGHVAVWFGANDNRNHWVQAGIAVQSGSSQPFLYVETTRCGHPSLQQWPVSLRHHVRIRIVSRGGRWSVQAAGHRSPFVWLAGATIDSMLETYGQATGTAKVGDQRIST